jgi:hypothetical protein
MRSVSVRVQLTSLVQVFDRPVRSSLYHVLALVEVLLLGELETT